MGIHISKLNLISRLSAIFLTSFFPWCIISSIVTSSYSCQLNTFIKLAGDTLYPHPLPKTNKDIKLTWFYSSSIEALLDTFPCLGMAIYHCFWM